ncbi:hypothetical protein [Frankia gtarii]|uniref:hypothetical protein n=1 Tax=Frankia gtarii TaxID=2950102 RepID=UPI0021C0D97D|nr:hypothetical protein [Frankia gtarii]
MHGSDGRRIRGRLRLDARAPDGRLLARRQATNAVLRGGAELVARRLGGLPADPITAVGVGFGTEAADAGMTALARPADVSIPASALTSPVSEGEITIQSDGPDAVLLSVATVFHPTAKLTDVTEAGLLAGDRLYNQVVFEPVTLDVDQDVTFFWEIDFPFGR